MQTFPTPQDHPMWPEQERIEDLMATRGVERFRRDAEAAAQAGNASKHGGARFILRHLVDPATKAIDAFIAEATSGKAGRKHRLIHLVTALPSETVAFLTAKKILDSTTSRGVKLGGMATALGRDVELEQPPISMPSCGP